jgi:septal ring-binding cell division protein DamX
MDKPLSPTHSLPILAACLTLAVFPANAEHFVPQHRQILATMPAATSHSGAVAPDLTGQGDGVSPKHRRVGVNEIGRANSGPNLYGEILLGGAEPSLGIPDPGMNRPTPARIKVASASPAPVRPSVARTMSSPQSIPSDGKQAFVQVGAFSQIDNAQLMSEKVGQYFQTDIEEVRLDGADFFRVFAGPFSTRKDAQSALETLSVTGAAKGFLINR